MEDGDHSFSCVSKVVTLPKCGATTLGGCEFPSSRLYRMSSLFLAILTNRLFTHEV